MSRDIPQAARDLIKRFEADPRTGSFAATRYPDPPGQTVTYSLGWGHLILPHEAWVEPITEAEANEQMEFDLANVAADVDRMVVPAAMADLTDNQYAALLDIVFNEGAGHISSSTLLKMVNAHAFGRASVEFLRWIYVSGERSAGLLKRREAEQALWQS